MLVPCVNGIICPTGSPEPDSPITNYTSEGPEQQPEYTSLIFPPLWDRMGCIRLCTSAISQNDADLCVLAQVAQCNPTPPCLITPCDGPPLFFSNATTCSCTTPGGSTFVYSIPAGTFSGSTQAIADALAQAYTCNGCSDPGGPGPGTPLRPGTSFQLGPLPESLCLGNSASMQIATSQPGVAVLWAVQAGNLPPGLTLNTSNGLISGTTVGSGSYTFQIRAYNAQGNYAERIYFLCVIEISPPSMPSATIGDPYSQSLTASGCSSPSFWQVISGSLPPGLVLDSINGTITGVPTVAGNYIFEIEMSE